MPNGLRGANEARRWLQSRAPLALATLLLNACGALDAPGRAPAPAPITVGNPTARCAALAGTTVPAAAIGLPTAGATVASAVLQPADQATGLPEYCKVLGTVVATNAVDPPIRFELNLPTVWNVKTLQYGGGGFNGTIVTGLGNVSNGAVSATLPLAAGYATFGGDSGHEGPGGSFFANAQAAANYGGQSVKRTRDTAVFLEKAFYGSAPWKVYYQGGSKGGQEGLHAAQDYGADFDGVIAYYPAAQNPVLPLAWQRMWQAAYRAPGGYLGPAKQQFVKAKVLQACDALDGLADGIVSNTRACASTFDIGALRCTGGADTGDTCLSDAQIGTLRVASSPMTLAFPLANGITTVGPFPVLEGGDVSPWLDATGVGTSTGYYAFFDGTIKYFYHRDGAASSEGFDYREWQARSQQLSSLYDASNPNLDTFRSHGGKLLVVQGTTDMLVPHAMTTAYYQALRERYGNALPTFVRYYVIPGFAHGAGDFRATWDSLPALEAWVEQGRAPIDPVTVDNAPATRGRSRPLCEHPLYPKYVGGGDPNSASSFVCAQPG